MLRKIVCLILVVLVSSPLLSISQVQAAFARGIPTEVADVLQELLDLPQKQQAGLPADDHLASLLAFVGDGGGREGYQLPDHNGSHGAFLAFEVDSDLATLLAYAYNPAIPGHILSPGSLRLAEIVAASGSGDRQQWQSPTASVPVQVRRLVEHEEITPDAVTGAYYGYDVDRLMVLERFQGRNVFLSIAIQRKPSDVGKKGVSLGDRRDWDFLYSGRTGLTKPGLGWVRSYIYDSASVTIFVEDPQNAGPIQGATFKWLKAGWAGINMVKAHHIHQGLVRYAGDFTAILENDALPAVAELAAGFAVIDRLQGKALAACFTEYTAAMAAQYGKAAALADKPFRDLLTAEHYPAVNTQGQMRAALELEYFKFMMGKPSKIPEISSFAGTVIAMR